MQDKDILDKFNILIGILKIILSENSTSTFKLSVKVFHVYQFKKCVSLS